LISALAGYQGRVNLKKSLVYLMVALFILTASGSKAPPAWGLIIWILAKGSLVPKRLFSLKALFYFKTQSITGRFSHFPLQKGLILIMGQLFVILFFYKISKFFLNVISMTNLDNAQNVNFERDRLC